MDWISKRNQITNVQKLWQIKNVIRESRTRWWFDIWPKPKSCDPHLKLFALNVWGDLIDKQNVNHVHEVISDVMLPPNVSHSLSNHWNRKASSLTWRRLWNRCCWNSNWIGALCSVLYRLMIHLWFSCHLQPVL